MILNSVQTKNLDVIDNAFAFSENFVGCESEFLEIVEESFSAHHNITMAMARLEHHASINENAATLLESGISEFFKRAVEVVRKQWTRFVEWLGAMTRSFKLALADRSEWIKKNEKHLLDLDDQTLKGTTVKIGNELRKNNFSNVLEKFKAESESIVKSFNDVRYPDPQTMMEKLLVSIAFKAAAYRNAKNKLQYMERTLIGEIEEVELSGSVIRELLAVAKDTTTAVDKIGGYYAVAKSYIKAAEGIIEMKADSQEIAHKKIRDLRLMGNFIQQNIIALSSLLRNANSQAMHALAIAARLKSGEQKEVPLNHLRLNAPAHS